MHLTLRGTRLTSHVSRAHPRVHQLFSYSGHLVDAASAAAVADQLLTVYHRIGTGHWRYLTMVTTNAY